MKFERNKLILGYLVAISAFMELLDSTIINTSIPAIASSLHVHDLELKTAVTSYLISLAIFIPISGWAADRFGIKKIFSMAIIIFTISSVLCGLSSSLFELSFFRILQGFGGAMMVPVGRLMLIRTFSPSERMKVLSYVTLPALFGPVFGPLLGGFITTYFSWHWIFFINIPIGIIVFCFAQKYIPLEIEVPVTERKNFHFDIIGFILSGVCLSALSYSIENLGDSVWTHTEVFSLFCVGLISGILYYFHSKKITKPIIDLALLKIRTFRIPILQMICMLTGAGGIPFLLPILFQEQFKMSPLESGLLIFPLAIGGLVMKPFVGTLNKIFSPRKVLIISPIMAGIAIFLFTFITRPGHPLLIALICFFYGLWYPLMLTTMTVISYVDIEKSHSSRASSFQSAIVQFAASLGVGFSAFFITFWLSFYQVKLGNLETNHQVINSFHICFIAMGVLCIAAGTIALWLKPDDGEQKIEKNTPLTFSPDSSTSIKAQS